MISQDTARKIIEQYSTPVYVFEEERFVKNFMKLQSAFRTIYPNFHIAYSYKTNYTPYICKLVKQLGGYAEVVSDMEYQLAELLNYESEKIIYNGPYKGRCMEQLFKSGGIVNIDSVDEATRITALATKHHEKSFGVGLRMNTDIGAGYISRFGIDDNEAEIRKVIEILAKAENIHIVGLHCHISRFRGIEAWKKRIENLMQIADRYIEGTPQYIDVGSGMFGEMDDSFAAQFPMHIPSYEEYAQVVAGAMKQHYGTDDGCPMLITEPGTTVVANYFDIISQVKAIKQIKNKTFATLDISYYNTGEVCLMKKMPYMVINSNEGDRKIINGPIELMGFTCLEQDCLYHDFMDDLSIDDYIIFGNIGGYSIVSKPPFIQPNCPVIAVRDDGTMIEIKRQETFEDVFATFDIRNLGGNENA